MRMIVIAYYDRTNTIGLLLILKGGLKMKHELKVSKSYHFVVIIPIFHNLIRLLSLLENIFREFIIFLFREIGNKTST